MAKQITFKPRSHDPSADVHAKLEKASVAHAAAILSLYELLQEAENRGVLDLLRGGIRAGDTITGKLAEYANTPSGIISIRNLLLLGRVFGSINPELLNRGVNDLTVDIAHEIASRQQHPPSAWQTLRRAFSGDALRGLSLMVTILASVGRTLAHTQKR